MSLVIGPNLMVSVVQRQLKVQAYFQEKGQPFETAEDLVSGSKSRPLLVYLYKIGL